MKYFIPIIIALFTITVSAQNSTTLSQNKSSIKATKLATSQSDTVQTNFVVLTSKFQQLEPIMLAAQEMKNSFGVFKIVLYGSEVGEFTKPTAERYIKWAKATGVNLSVCAMALERMKVDPKSIPKEIEIVDNAYLHSLQLQKKGYKSLSL